MRIINVIEVVDSNVQSITSFGVLKEQLVDEAVKKQMADTPSLWSGLLVGCSLYLVGQLVVIWISYASMSLLGYAGW